MTKRSRSIACLLTTLLLGAAAPARATSANDAFARAGSISAIPGSITGNTTGATLEPGEPAPCGQIGATVWYSFTVATDQALQIDTFGSGYNTVLAVYAGASLPSLTSIACNDGYEGGLHSRILVQVSAGRTYNVQVGGSQGSVGAFALNLTVLPTVVGDSFAQAIAVDTFPFEDERTTLTATLEQGEPSPCWLDGSTIWYRFEPTVPGPVSVTTAGSGFNTVLVAYSGTRLADLTVQDWDCGDVTDVVLEPPRSQAMVGFLAEPGTTYYIQASGYESSQGDLSLRISHGAHATVGFEYGYLIAGGQADERYQQVDVTGFAIVFSVGVYARVRDGRVEDARVCAFRGHAPGTCAP